MSSFQIIKAEDRTARMMGWFSGICKTITDFVAGSEARTKIETIAVEMETQDLAFYQAMKRAIPLSIYQAFGFSLRPAVRASGIVTFSALTPPVESVPIPKGTKVTVTGGSKVYETANDSVLQVSAAAVDVFVVCTASGTIGNTAASTITEMVNAIDGIDSIANATAFSNGLDRETEAERKARFVEYITTLTRGTKGAVEYGATSAALTDANGNITEKVVVAQVAEPFKDNPQMPVGRFDCYIYNGVGGTSANLVAMAQKIIDGYTDANGNSVPGYKAAGVVCDVLAVTEVSVAISINITATATSSAAAKTYIGNTASNAVKAYIASLGISQPLFIAEIISVIMGIDGVYNAVVTTPSADVTAGVGEIIIAGNISATVA